MNISELNDYCILNARYIKVKDGKLNGMMRQ